MKALRISTALSLLLLQAAPSALAVGDPNIDSGVGSAASRGVFGFSNNSDAYYDTPPNSYGVFRDANGGLRDPGTIPDNLTARVAEQTWSQAHPPRGPIPSGAPGGFGIGYGGLGGLGGLTLGGGLGGLGGGLGGFGGLGGLAGITAAGLGLTGTQGIGVSPFPFTAGGITPVGVNGGIPIGISGAGPAGQAARTPFGFANTPGAFFTDFPNIRQRYMGVGSGFIPFNQQTISNSTNQGQSTTTIFNNSSSGPSYITRTTTPVAGGGSDTVTQFYQNGNSYFVTSQTRPNGGGTGTTPTGTTQTGATPTGAGTGSGTLTTVPNTGTSSNGIPANGVNGSGTANDFFPVVPPNTTTTTFMDSNNGFSNPAIPNSANTVIDNSAIAHQQSGLGGGFATPATSGDQRSAFFTDTQSTGNGGGFATPQTSGSPRSLYFNNSPSTGSIGGGFATGQTSGSERATAFPNSNNQFGFGGGGLGGIAGATGNRAGRETTNETANYAGGENRSTAGSSFSGDINSGLAGRANRNGGTEFGSLTTGGPDRFGFYGPIPTGTATTTTAAPLRRQRNQAATFGSETEAGLTGGESALIAQATGGQSYTAPSASGRKYKRTPGQSSGQRASGRITAAQIAQAAAMPFSPAAYQYITPLNAAVVSKMQMARRMNNGLFAAGNGLQGNLTSDLEVRLRALNLTACEAIGRVLGSTHYDNGDIITYGSKGTLKLSPDNSGSITFNDGLIMTFIQATPELRALALKSVQFL